MRANELFEAPTGFQIYCDMDGVLVDFEGGVQKIMNNPNYNIDDKNQRKDFWKLMKTMPQEEAVELWATLDWAPGGQELWKYISRFHAAILSSPGYSLRPLIEAGKMKWIKKNLRPQPSSVILTPDKYKHANKFSILIDDMPKNIIPWEEKGGVGILYKTGNYKPAIKELQDRFGFPK